MQYIQSKAYPKPIALWIALALQIPPLPALVTVRERTGKLIGTYEQFPKGLQ